MIITYPNPILEKKAQEITEPQIPAIQRLILEMIDQIESDGNAIGLAAPQVGQSIRLCVIKLNGKTHILINPKIKSRSWKKIVSEEGCLSFPGQFFPVKRNESVKVKALDRKGKAFIIEANGLFSRALQHEIDHLDGILFITKIYKSKKNEKDQIN